MSAGICLHFDHLTLLDIHLVTTSSGSRITLRAHVRRGGGKDFLLLKVGGDHLALAAFFPATTFLPKP